MEDLKPGQLVRSLAGRDKGQYYFVIEVLDRRFVKVVDGKYKLIAKPKKKNTMHLQPLKYLSGEFIEQLKSGKLTDSRVAYLLKETGQAKLEREV